jgi:hypothetical protein
MNQHISLTALFLSLVIRKSNLNFFLQSLHAIRAGLKDDLNENYRRFYSEKSFHGFYACAEEWK